MHIRDCPAGPRLDALCADTFGLEWHKMPTWISPGWQVYSLSSRDAWPPSTDIAAAWELVEAMQHAAWDVEVRVIVAMPDECSVYRMNDAILVIADTPQLAICRAFLLAHGISEIDLGGS